MANGFDYESPLNRLLNVTIPELVSGQLTREESKRRFDKQLELENRDRQDRISRENQERIRQNELLNEERRQFNENLNVQRNANTLEENRQNRAEKIDVTTRFLNITSQENDIPSARKRLEMFRDMENVDPGLIDAEIANLTSIENQQKDDLSFYKESGILGEKVSAQLERLIGKRNFNERVNKFYEISISNNTAEEKRNLEVLKLQYDNNAKRIRDLDEIVSSGIGDTKGAQSERDALVTAQSELISTFKGKPTVKKTEVGANAKKAVDEVGKNVGRKIDVKLVSELNNLSTDASLQDIQSIFESYGITDANDQAEIIDALERDDVPEVKTNNIVQRTTAPGLNEQQQSGLERVRQLDGSGVADFLQSLLRPVAEAGQRAGEAVRNMPAPRGSIYKPAG
jgi:hypothetical protein